LIVTLLASIVIEPCTSLASTTAPSVVTVMGPLLVSWVPGGTPVLVASGKPHE
jgi:hypothetical protein